MLHFGKQDVSYRKAVWGDYIYPRRIFGLSIDCSRNGYKPVAGYIVDRGSFGQVDNTDELHTFFFDSNTNGLNGLHLDYIWDWGDGDRDGEPHFNLMIQCCRQVPDTSLEVVCKLYARVSKTISLLDHIFFSLLSNEFQH